MDGLCRHPLLSPGAPGAACTGDESCAIGTCFRARGICGERCKGADQRCPASFACEVEGPDAFCIRTNPPPSPDGGCHVDRVVPVGSPGADHHDAGAFGIAALIADAMQAFAGFATHAAHVTLDGAPRETGSRETGYEVEGLPARASHGVVRIKFLM